MSSRELALFKRFCNTVWEYDALTNEVYLHHSQTMPEWCGSWRPYDEVYTLHKKYCIYKEDTDIWAHYMLPENLRRFLQSDREEEHFLVRKKYENYEIEWREAYLEKISDSRLFIGSRDINEMQRSTTVSQAAMTELDYVCRIDIATRNYVFYYSGDVRGLAPQHESSDYHKMITEFNRQIVAADECEALNQNMMVERVLEELLNKEEYVLYATVEEQGQICHKKFRFCYADAQRKELLLTRVDVTKETFLVDELQRSREEMRHVLETTTDLVFQYYPEQRSASFRDLGTPHNAAALPEDLLLQKLVGKGYLEESSEEVVKQALKEIRDGKQNATGTLRARKTIDMPWSWFKLVMFDYQDEYTRERRVLGYIQNIDHDVIVREHLQQMAQIDYLTGILNVGAGKCKIKNLLEKQGETAGDYNAMFLMDIDDFKQVNDTQGHSVGDEVLKRFAQVLSETFRTKDIVYRLGGDEFAAFVEKIPDYEAAVESIMERFRLKFSEARESCPFLSASVGIFVSNTTKDYQRYYQEADRALYETKKNGKNHYTIRIATTEDVYYYCAKQRFDAAAQTK